MRKYPPNLFLIGLITNIIFHFFWLFVPSFVLMMVGIFSKPCLFVGLALLLLDLILSFAEQMRIRKAFLQDSDNPEFQQFQDALSKDGNWINNIKDFVEEKIDNNDQYQ